MSDVKRQIISRNEQNEVSPPHRIAGGVRFDGVEKSGATRAAKVESRKSGHRGLNVPTQFHKAARSRKPTLLDI